MKNKITTLLPAVALLALSSCASTSGLTSTESDGVYYSSKDRTTQTVVASSGYESTGQSQSQVQGIDEDTNPEYSTSNGNATDGSNTEYYDDSYASRLSRFNGSTYSGLSYYSPVYTDPYFMGGYSAFSPYGLGYYDPFYSPFGYYGGSPFGYGLGGSYLSLGFGNYWGARPYGLGLGYGPGYYDSFYNPYYGGLYGGYYGGRGYGYSNYGNTYYAGRNDNGRGATLYAPRRDRAREAMSAGRPQPGSGRLSATSVGGMTASPSSTSATTTNPNTIATGRSRGRILEETPSQPQSTGGFTSPGTYNVRERAMSDSEIRAREGRPGRLSEAGTANPGTTTSEQPRIDYSGRRRMQQADNTSGGATTAPQEYAQPQRRARFSEVYRNNNTSEQSAPQRTYSQPSRTYSEPQMSSPAPSSSGGSFGGGNSGGGGGRGRVR